jgi:fibrillarin-like rRNA methylase
MRRISRRRYSQEDGGVPQIEVVRASGSNRNSILVDTEAQERFNREMEAIDAQYKDLALEPSQQEIAIFDSQMMEMSKEQREIISLNVPTLTEGRIRLNNKKKSGL